MNDWTVSPDGYSNSSAAYLAIVDAVARLIRDAAASLVGHDNGPDACARLIVSHLAHVHGLAPPAAGEGPIAVLYHVHKPEALDPGDNLQRGGTYPDLGVLELVDRVVTLGGRPGWATRTADGAKFIVLDEQIASGEWKLRVTSGRHG